MKNRDIKLIHYTLSQKDSFIPLVETELRAKFKCDIAELPDNYGRKSPWSLLSLLDSGDVDDYTLMYIDGQFRGAGGGRVLGYLGSTVYQAGLRGFNSNTSLKHFPYYHEYVTRFHLKRAKINNCSELIMSFNDYNYRLFRLVRDHHWPMVFGPGNFQASDNLEIFNEVPQWLLKISL